MVRLFTDPRFARFSTIRGLDGTISYKEGRPSAIRDAGADNQPSVKDGCVRNLASTRHLSRTERVQRRDGTGPTYRSSSRLVAVPNGRLLSLQTVRGWWASVARDRGTSGIRS